MAKADKQRGPYAPLTKAKQRRTAPVLHSMVEAERAYQLIHEKGRTLGFLAQLDAMDLLYQLWGNLSVRAGRVFEAPMTQARALDTHEVHAIAWALHDLLARTLDAAEMKDSSVALALLVAQAEALAVSPEGPATPVRRVRIPRCDDHQGLYAASCWLPWVCPACGGPRGELFKEVSYDGARFLVVSGWENACGHLDTYPSVRAEVKSRTAVAPPEATVLGA